MKIVRENQTIKFQNSPGCLAIEYPLGDKDINGAIIKLNGRYPEKGWAINIKCKEMALILKGLGTLVVDGQEYEVNKDDLVLIMPGEKYYWKGKMDMFMPCAPAWYPEQHKLEE